MQNTGTVWSKTLRVILAIVLVVGLMPISSYSLNHAYASGENDPAPQGVSEDPSTFVIKVNDSSAAAGQNLQIGYDKPMAFTLAGHTGSEPVNFSYATPAQAEENDWTPIKDGRCSLEPGEYYLNYSVTIDYHEYKAQTGQFKIKVVPSQLDTPAGLQWNADTLSWSPVTPTKTDAIKGYEFVAYRTRGEVTEEVRRGTITDTSYRNFANHVTEQYGYGAGSYSFTVQALVSEAEKSRYLDSDVSTSCSGYTAAEVSVSVADSTGIASMNINGHESWLLAPTSSGAASSGIEAAALDGYQFDHWNSCEPEIAEPNNAKTTITVPVGYDGPAYVTLRAVAVDVAPPTVSNFVGNASGILSGTVADGQDGVAKWAFSTANKAEEVEWTELLNPVASQEVEGEPSGSGAFYLWAMDAAGNFSYSSNAVKVTEVTYSMNYDGGSTYKTTHMVDGTSYAFPQNPTRSGWTFENWYTDPSCTGEPVAADKLAYNENGITLYAKWSQKELPDDLGVEPIGKTYNGVASDLTVKITDEDGVTYQWLKWDKEAAGYVVIPEATSKTLSVKDVAESGTYKVIVTRSYGSGVDPEVRWQEDISVVIDRASLEIDVKPINKVFGDAAPTAGEYEFTYKGIVSGESVETTGEATTDYKQGDPVGNYAVTLSGFAADNYEITYPCNAEDQTRLTVTAKEITEAKYVDKAPTYTYQAGEAYTLEDGTYQFKVGDKWKTLVRDADFEVTYDGNEQAGTATATFEMKGDYSGTVSLEFEIAKAGFAPVVSIEPWMYGDQDKDPSCADVPSDYAGTITYEYAVAPKPGEQAVYSADKPVNAGDYLVRAVFDGDSNYEGAVSDGYPFTISKRKVIVTANSDTFDYDGLAHEVPGYVVTGDGFAPKEGFERVVVEGTATEATDENGVPNNITSYTPTSITNLENYDIEPVPGKIVINPLDLTCPTGIVWDASRPGTLTWVPVSRKNLEVSYVVTLYAYDATAETDKYTEVRSVPVDKGGRSVNLADVIRAHAAENPSVGYVCTVQSIPADGSSKNNYVASNPSGYTSAIHTANVSAAAGDYVSSVTINGGTSALLIEGEKAAIAVTTQEGTEWFGQYAVAPEGDKSRFILGLGEFEGVAQLEFLAGDTSINAATITVTAQDMPPMVTSYTAAKTADLSSVDLSFTAYDGQGLAGYMITTSSTAPSADDSGWIELLGKNGGATVSVAASGAYYIWVKDTAGKVASNYVTSVNDEGEEILVVTPINVYEVKLQPGDGSGEAKSLFKPESQSIALPSYESLPYTKTGYGFQNWSGSTGLYVDEGTYGANQNDVLTALWTNNRYDYTVNYYFMEPDGTYIVGTPESSKTFNVVYNTKVAYDQQSIQQVRPGFTLDSDYAPEEDLVVTEDGLALNLYYKRNDYKLTLSYTEPDASEPTTYEHEYKYGAPFASNVFAKPIREGYDFVGWTFNDGGAQPETMPSHDVVATGEFQPKMANYHIRYYVQDLNADGTAVANTYSLKGDLQFDNVAPQGTELLMNAALAEQVEGFSFAKVAQTAGALQGQSREEGSDVYYVIPDGAKDAIVTNAQVADADHEMYLNVFLNRDTYPIYLNVWKGEVGVDAPMYHHEFEKVAFGAKIPEGINEFDKENWWPTSDPDKDEYILAAYTGWSTGDKPTTMPAGDVTVTRQYVIKTICPFNVEVWVEGETDNVYSRQMFTYYDYAGILATIDEEDGTIKPSAFGNSIDFFDHYVAREVTDKEFEDGVIKAAEGGPKLNGGTVSSGQVANTQEGADRLTLRVFFERETVTTTINYYYTDASGNRTKFATATKQGKWGENRTYNYEPLAFFDTELKWNETPKTVKIEKSSGISDPATYDFRKNKYVVTVVGQYNANYDTHWNTSKLYSVESLKNSYTGQYGYSGNVVTVEYALADPLLQYPVDVVYNADGLSGITDDNDYPVQQTVGGETYNVRIANKAYFYDNVKYVAGEKFKDYPGLANLNLGGDGGHYDLSGTDVKLKSVYSEIEWNGKQYFVDNEYLYIPLADNPFFVGNRASYTFKIDKTNLDNSDPGYVETIKNFLDAYKAARPADPYAQGADVYGHWFGSKIVYEHEIAPSTQQLRITFHNGNVYNLLYTMGDTVCKQHEYAEGTEISTFKCNDGTFATIPGYHITWYSDKECTTKAATLKINKDTPVYGLYENDVYENTEYAYYELADYVVVDGKTYDYITEKDLSAFTGDEKLTSDTAADGTTTYKYNGTTVMVKRSVSQESFHAIKMDLESLAPVAGTLYDTSNPVNKIEGYVQTAPVELVAYFSREKVTFTADPNHDKANAETTAARAQQTVKLPKLERDGYVFGGWKWYKVIDGNKVEWTGADTPAAGAKVIQMPECDVIAEAMWVAADLDNLQITHYFQNPSLSYDIEGVTKAKVDTKGTDATVSLGGETMDAKLLTDGYLKIEQSDGTVWYFSKGTLVGSIYMLAWEDLAAIVEPLKVDGSEAGTKRPVKQDEDLTISDHKQSATHYSFAYAQNKTAEDVTTHTEGDVIKCTYDMELSYFYAIEQPINVNAVGLELNNRTAKITVVGAGSHVYGEDVTLTATLPQGYTLIGWFNGVDVLDEDGKVDEAILDSDGNIKQEVLGKALSSNHSVAVKAYENNANYVCLVSSDAVAVPKLFVAGKETLPYGYTVSKENAVTVKAEKPEGASDANYIKGYQWYLKTAEGMQPIEGATSATYLYPTDWQAGTYTLVCDVTVARKDNGLESTYSSDPFTVTVTPAKLDVTVAPYDDYFDLKDHSIAIKVNSPIAEGKYKIWYSDVELNAENLNDPNTPKSDDIKDYSYTNVAVDGTGAVIDRTVYFYIESSDGNYASLPGNNTVLIKPLTVTLQESTGKFWKTYDGQAEVAGSIDQPGSDLYRLSYSDDVYKIIGILNGDPDAAVYAIVSSATFDNRHASTASALTLSDIYLINKESKDRIYNYVFQPSYTVTIPGYIESKEIEVTWDDLSFIYNDQMQAPTPSLDVSQLPTIDTTTIGESVVSNLKVVASGEQKLVGTYNATAKLILNDAVAENKSEARDFVLKNGGIQKYEIKPVEIAIKPDAVTVPYDGQNHTLSNYQVVEGLLVAGHTQTSSSSQSGRDPGTYPIAADSVVIKNGDGVDVTANYQIDKQPNTLEITQNQLKISGIVICDKTYDGTTVAQIDKENSRVVITGAVEGEQVSIDLDKVQVSFADANRGDNKMVSVVIPAEAITGTDAAKYTAIIAQDSAKANITPAVITVKADDKSAVYGQASVAFGVQYSGFVNGEGAEKIYGTVSSYTLEETGNPYDSMVGFGDYKIVPDVSDLTSDNGNYTFQPAEGTLTVSKRPLSVGAVSGKSITKVYDASTDAAFDSTHYEYGSVSGQQQSGIVNGDNPSLTAKAEFNSKNVADANTVSFTALSIDNANYILVTEAFGMDGSITPKPLDLKVKDETVTYGATQNPDYSLTVGQNGFADGEDLTNLVGNLVFDSGYDANTSGKREVKTGGYSVSAQGSYAETTNYEIHFSDGVVTVIPKQLTVTATSNPNRLMYGTSSMPEFGYDIAGFEYGEDKSVVQVLDQVTYDHPGLHELQFTYEDTSHTVIDSIPGQYTVTPIIEDKLAAQNYTFKVASCYVDVEKLTLSVSKIAVKPRVYDGTTAVRSTQFDYSDVTWGGLLDIDKYLAEQAGYENILSVTAEGTYESKDVKVDIPVSITSITLSDYLAARYTQSGSQTTAPADITKRPLLITADKKTIYYGEQPPEYTYTPEKQLSDRGLLDNEKTNLDQIKISCSYKAGDGISTETVKYVIDVSDFKGSPNYENYKPVYVPGELTVLANTFPDPAPKWSEAVPGKVTWNAIGDIGSEYVTRYDIQLFKVSGQEETAISDVIQIGKDAALEYDFSGLIHESAGAYKVKVKAVSSNEDNVHSSNDGKSDALYAANVHVVFNDSSLQKSAPTINNASSYVMIAGEGGANFESGIDIAGQIKNGTGYTVSSITSSNPSLKIQKGDDTARNSEQSKEGDLVQDKVRMLTNLSSAEDVTVTINLAARQSTFNVEVTPRPETPGHLQAHATYGYSVAPELKATVSETSKQLSPAEGYKYTYNWQYKVSASGPIKSVDPVITNEPIDNWEFPLGMNANTVLDYYWVRCYVSVERLDNGETSESKQTWSNKDSSVTNVSIDRAAFSAEVAIDGWMYGESRKAPSLTNLVPYLTPDQHPGLNNVQYMYRAENSSGEWSTTIPKNAGTYDVKAYIPISTNYNEFTTQNTCKLVIAPNQLVSPKNLTLVNGNDSFATLQWGAVNGPVENKGVNPDSSISVTYDVKLLKKKDDGTWDEVATYPGLTGTSQDVTDKVAGFGAYKFEVTAKSSNTDNCLDSEVATQEFSVGATVYGYNGVYDGKSHNVTVTLPEGKEASAYHWYKDGKLISDATGQTISVKHVLDSGSYVCVAEIDKKNVVSTAGTVSITPASLTVTTQSSSKVYDGTPLKAGGTIEGFQENEENVKETATFTVTGSQTVFGDSTNTYTLVYGGTAVSTDYQTPTENLGTLSVSKRDVTFAGDTDSNRMYNGELQEVITYAVSGYEADGKGKGLVTGHKTVVDEQDTVQYKASGTDVKYDGAGNIVAYPGEITPAASVHIFDAEGNDVTTNYNISTVAGSLTIVKSTADWSIEMGDDECTYDAAEHGTSKTPTSHAATGTTSYQYKFADDSAWTSDLSSLKKVNANEDGYVIRVQATNPNYEKVATCEPKLTIHKRQVTFMGDTNDAAIYSGLEQEITAYAVSGYEADGKGKGLVAGHTTVVDEQDTVQYRANGTDVKYDDAGGVVAYPGAFTNAEGISIRDAAGSDVTSNYAITATPGALTINPRSLNDSNISHGTINNVVYDGKSHQLKTDVYYKVSDTRTDTLGSGDYDITYFKGGQQTEDFTNVGTITVIMTGKGNFKDSIQTTYSITQRPVVFTGKSEEKVYKGAEWKIDTVIPSGKQGQEQSGLLSGTTHNVEFEASGTEVDQYPGFITARENVKLTCGGKDVTANYSIETVSGTLTITKSDEDWSISLADADPCTYDGKPHYNLNTPVSGAATEKDKTVYKYRFQGQGEDAWKSSLSELTKVDAGTYTIEVSATHPDYSKPATTTATLTINKCQVTLTSASDEREYNGEPLTNNNVTVTAGSFAEGEGLESFQATGSVTYVTEGPYADGKVANAFTYKLKENTKPDNYQITPVEGILSVIPRTGVVITVTEKSDSLPYNGFEQSVTGYTVSINSELYEESDFAFKGDAIAKGTDVDFYPMQLNPGNFTNNNPNFADVTFKIMDGGLTITKVSDPITITAASDEKVYDGNPLTNNAYTYTENILKGNDKLVAVVDGSVTDVANSPASNVVTSYKVMRGEGDAAVDVTGNYAFENSVPGQLVITKRPVVIQGISEPHVYTGEDITISQVKAQMASDDPTKKEGLLDGVTHNVTFTATGKDVNGTVVTSITDAKDVILTSSNGIDVTNNYAITTKSGVLTINPKTLTDADTVEASTIENVVYTGTPHQFEATVTFKTVKGATQTLEKGKDYDVEYFRGDNKIVDPKDFVDVGTITVVMRGKGNFEDSITRSYAITQAPIDIVTPTASKVYDGDPLTAKGSMTGLVDGEAATFTTTGTQTAVGTSDNTYTLVWDGTAKETNYFINSTSVGELTVTEYAEQIVVTTTGGSWTYDGKSHGATVQVSTLPKGYSVEKATASATATHVDDSKYGVNCDNLVIKNAQGKDVTSELDIKYVPGDIVITPATLTVVTESAKRVYTGEPLTAGGSISGYIGTDTAAFTVTGSQTVVGDSPNTYKIVWDGTAAESDYKISETVGELKVLENDTPIIVTVTGGSWTYDGQPHGATVSVSELPAGYTLETATSSQRVTNVADGKVTAVCDSLVIRNAEGEDVTSRLNVDNTSSAELEITPAKVEVVADAITKIYSFKDPDLTCQIKGLVEGEDESLIEYAVSRQEGEDVGDYAINVSGEKDQGNYEVSFTDAVFTVEPLDISQAEVTLEGFPFFTGLEQQQVIQSVVVKGTDGKEDVAVDEYTVVGDTATAAGEYELTITGFHNFTGSVKVKWQITDFQVEAIAKETADRAKAEEYLTGEFLKTLNATAKTKGKVPASFVETTPGALYDAILAGEGYIVELVVKEVANDPRSPKVEPPLDSVTPDGGSHQVVVYWDITLVVKTAKGGKVIGQIVRTEKDLDIAIPLTDKQLQALTGKVYAVRVHGDQGQLINVSVVNGKAQFATNLFSLYALANVVEPNPVNPVDPNNTAKTGDDLATTAAPLGAVALAAAGVVVVAGRKRRKKDQEEQPV